MKAERGATLVEILIAMVVIVVASIAALSYFSYGRGSIGKQGNRRAAQELARQRLEQLLETNSDDIKPADLAVRWLTCAGTPCVWTIANAQVQQPVTVGNFPGTLPIETTVQCIHDPNAGTVAGNCDTLALDVKVWYTNTGADDDFNRVHIRTLRTPL